MKATLKVDGLKALDAQLSELGNTVGVQVLRASVRAAAKPMVQKAKANAPYNADDDNEYHIRDNIRLQTVPKKYRKSTVEFYLGAARVTSTSGKRRIIGGLGVSSKSPNYARILERKKPWLRPAFDSEYRGFISGLKTILAKRIEKAVKKARKV